MSNTTSSVNNLLLKQIATWPTEKVNGLFRLPQGVETLPGVFPALKDTEQVREWLQENARLLVGLEWTTSRFLRLYAVDVSPKERLYLSDSDAYFPNSENGVRLLAEFNLGYSDDPFLRRLFRTNGVGFGLILLPDVPSDVESSIEDFGELLSLFSVGFSSGDLWERLKEKHPGVWNEAYENPVKASHGLVHRLHDERIQAAVEARGSVELVNGKHPDELSLLEAERRAGEDLGLRHWSHPEEKRRIIARYLSEVLHY